jgi:DNA-directed RNA polymerase subunit RPC12/RpoP
MIRFTCGHCGRTINVDARYAGKKGKCPKCGTVVTVPERSTVITFHCGKCGHKIKVPVAHAGKRGRCPKCKSPIVAPGGEDKPAEHRGAAAVTCSMCGQVIEPAEDSQEPFMECPGCGAYIETSSGNLAPAPAASPDLDEGLAEESAGTAGSATRPNRRLIILVSAVAAVVVLGCIVLVVALRSPGPRSARGPEALPEQREVAATSPAAQPAVPVTPPDEPVVEKPVKEAAAPKPASEPEPAVESPGTISLQFRPVPGTKRTVQLVTRLVTSVEADGQQQNMTNTRVCEFDLEVAEPPGDGTVAVNVSLAAIREKWEAPGQVPREYDSTKPPREGDTIGGIYASFLDNRFTIRVSPRGEIVDPGLDGLFLAAAERRAQDEDKALRTRLGGKADPAIQRMDARFGSRENRVLALKKQLEEFPVFGKEQVAGLLNNLIVALPDKPLRSGDTWEGPLTVNTGERLQMPAMYTLVDVEQGACTILATGQRSLDDEPIVSEGGQMKMISKLGGSSRTTWRIERRTGWLLSEEHTASLRGETRMIVTGPPAQDTSRPASLEITSTLTTLK